VHHATDEGGFMLPSSSIHLLDHQSMRRRHENCGKPLFRVRVKPMCHRLSGTLAAWIAPLNSCLPYLCPVALVSVGEALQGLRALVFDNGWQVHHVGFSEVSGLGALMAAQKKVRKL